MARIRRKTKVTTHKIKEYKRPATSNLSLEERLKVIANLIVDRIVEDQQNGTLRFRTHTQETK